MPVHVKEKQTKRLLSRVPRPLVGAPKATGLICTGCLAFCQGLAFNLLKILCYRPHDEEVKAKPFNILLVCL